jgi:hypothetical protein
MAEWVGSRLCAEALRAKLVVLAWARAVLWRTKTEHGERVKVVSIVCDGRVGPWRRGLLEVECNRSEHRRFRRLSDIFHPELHVLKVRSTGVHNRNCPDERLGVQLEILYLPVQQSRIPSLLAGRMLEIIPALDLQSAGGA